MAKQSKDIIAMVEEYFDRLPELPRSWRDVIFKITPWLAVIFGILGVLVSLIALGASGLATLFGGSSLGTVVTFLLGLVSSLLLLAASPKLFAKKRKGWEWLFWSQAIAVLSSVLQLSVIGVIFALIGVYLIFQIKSYYRA